VLFASSSVATVGVWVDGAAAGRRVDGTAAAYSGSANTQPRSISWSIAVIAVSSRSGVAPHRKAFPRRWELFRDFT